MDTGARQPSKTFSTRMTGSPASADARLYLITRKLGKRDRPPPCFLPPVPLSCAGHGPRPPRQALLPGGGAPARFPRARGGSQAARRAPFRRQGHSLPREPRGRAPARPLRTGGGERTRWLRARATSAAALPGPVRRPKPASARKTVRATAPHTFPRLRQRYRQATCHEPRADVNSGLFAQNAPSPESKPTTNVLHAHHRTRAALTKKRHAPVSVR